jgi:hypothetical protein
MRGSCKFICFDSEEMDEEALKIVGGAINSKTA